MRMGGGGWEGTSPRVAKRRENRFMLKVLIATDECESDLAQQSKVRRRRIAGSVRLRSERLTSSFPRV